MSERSDFSMLPFRLFSTAAEVDGAEVDGSDPRGLWLLSASPGIKVQGTAMHGWKRTPGVEDDDFEAPLCWYSMDAGFSNGSNRDRVSAPRGESGPWVSPQARARCNDGEQYGCCMARG